MNWEHIILNAVSQAEKEPHNLADMWNPRMSHSETLRTEWWFPEMSVGWEDAGQ